MIIILLFITGLLFGSFVNALVWRLKTKRDWVQGRSECVHCKHQLAARDLIPVASWISLKGRCRYCSKPISPQYPIVELLTAVLFTASYAYWPDVISNYGLVLFIAWLGLLVLFMALSLFDVKYMILPNRLVALAGAITVFAVAVRIFEQQSFIPIIDSLLGLVFFGGIFYLLFQFSKGKWIGGGDVKLGFVLGAWLAGPMMSILAIFIASLIGMAVAAVLLLQGKAKLKSRIPFGPMLMLATVIVQLFGQILLTLYYESLGLQ